MKRLGQKILRVRFAFLLARVFFFKLIEVLKNEEVFPEYLAQKQFENCLSRGSAIVEAAINPVKLIIGGAICTHRTKVHGDDFNAESAEIGSQLSDPHAKITTRGWWKS